MSRHWYNNGEVQIFRELPPDDSYTKGMLQSSKEKMSNKIVSEETRLRMRESKLGTHLSEETKQKLKGRTPWNKGGTSWSKGLTKETDERVAKYAANISIGSMGKVGSNLGKHFTDEHKKKIGDANRGKSPKKLTPEQLRIKTTKQYLTRKKNDTFNKSKPEQELYETLLTQYANKTILRQYKDGRYPFYCDFYIEEDDLFIELNAHWTHGGMPFDPNSIECQKQLSEWQEKAKTSKFYANAIQTWTVRDVLKRGTALKNNLNYKVIY